MACLEWTQSASSPSRIYKNAVGKIDTTQAAPSWHPFPIYKMVAFCAVLKGHSYGNVCEIIALNDRLDLN
jgi:hypothetical protein